MGNINVDYYYGVETKEFKELSFYCIPKFLITDERFRYLSNDAKMLYVLMLDKMSLSMHYNTQGTACPKLRLKIVLCRLCQVIVGKYFL